MIYSWKAAFALLVSHVAVYAVTYTPGGGPGDSSGRCTPRPKEWKRQYHSWRHIATQEQQVVPDGVSLPYYIQVAQPKVTHPCDERVAHPLLNSVLEELQATRSDASSPFHR